MIAGIGQGGGGAPAFDFGLLLPLVTGAGSFIGAIFGYIILPVWVFYLLKDRVALVAQFDTRAAGDVAVRRVGGPAHRRSGSSASGSAASSSSGSRSASRRSSASMILSVLGRPGLRAVRRAAVGHRRHPRARPDHRTDHLRRPRRPPGGHGRSRGRHRRAPPVHPRSSRSRTTSWSPRSRATRSSSIRRPSCSRSSSVGRSPDSSGRSWPCRSPRPSATSCATSSAGSSPDEPEALAASIHGLGLEHHPGLPGPAGIPEPRTDPTA